MASPWILGYFFLASQILNIYCQNTIKPPPQVTESYKATGELVEEIPQFKGRVIQIAFEENYDAENKKLGFTLWQMGDNVTYIENLRINQTLKYTDDIICEVVTLTQWNDIGAPPYLPGYGDNSTIRFAVQKLMSLDPKYLKTANNKTYRGIPATEWAYELKSKQDGKDVTIEIYSYWSNSIWSSTSSEKSIPLGFIITTFLDESEKTLDIKTQQINVFSFVHGAIDRAVFEPKEGVYCIGKVKNEFQFPTLPKVDAVSIHSELAFNDQQDVKTIDTWYDMKNKLLRIDMDRIAGQQPIFLKQGRRITWEITSKELDATYEINIFQSKFTCTITPLKNYKFEVQDIINPKLDGKLWDVYHFFGVNTTEYIYMGKTTKRNIPCHMFQGLRTDFPEKSSEVVSLWEWCFAVRLGENDDIVEFRDGELPLVNVQVHFLESNNTDFPQDFRLTHHFYDVLAEDPNVIYNTAFDVSRCFNRTQKRNLQFTVDVNVTSENLDIIENATSDSNYLYLWRQQISQGSKLTIGSLRITKVRSTMYNRILYVMFTLLDVHPDLPNNKGYKSLKDVESTLRTAVDGGKLGFTYTYDKKKTIVLKVKPKSLVPQVDPTLIVHNDTTTVRPPRVTTTQGHSSSAEPVPSSSKGPNIDTPEVGARTSNTGTVVGVTIAMLAVGMSLGAAGTFYKFRGLPQCLRRA